MGNSQNDKNVAEKFKNTCHPGLSDCVYDSSHQTLVMPIKAQEGTEIWKKDVDPLMGKKHLFLPSRYNYQENLMDNGCCTQEDPNKAMVTCQVCYLPFFYTLEKEIITRRQKNSLFREIELWKLIGYLSKAIFQWMSVYPEQKLGVICPGNIVMSPQGQVKLVTKLSFFLQVFGSYHEYYSPPQSRGASMIKYALNPHRDPVAIEASLIYSSGAVILEAATLTLVDHEAFNRQQKELTFRSLNYSADLKDTVLGMVQPNQMTRIRIGQVLKRCKMHRNKH